MIEGGKGERVCWRGACTKCATRKGMVSCVLNVLDLALLMNDTEWVILGVPLDEHG